MIKYFLYISVLFSMFSCVKNNETLDAIIYNKIVGNYTGTDMICTWNEEALDTTCINNNENKVTVVIPNLSSIRISDINGQMDSINLTYIKSSTNNQQWIHSFEGNDNNAIITLEYQESLQSIKILKKETNDSQQSYFFEGVKTK